MKFFEVLAFISAMVGGVTVVNGYSPVETIASFGVMSVVFALLAIACAIREHGEKTRRGANPPQAKSDTRG